MAGRPLVRGWLPWLLRWILAALCATWRVRYEGRDAFERAIAEGAVLAFWHGEQLPIVFLHPHRGFAPIVSRSRDGELLSAIVTPLGYAPIRGSSSRGGSEAFHEALALLEAGRCPGVAVDGPRGPWHVPKHGALTLAARSGRPILMVVATARRAIRLKSWDRFEIPLPFTRVTVAYGRMEAPEGTPEAIAAAAEALAEAMTALSAPASTRP